MRHGDDEQRRRWPGQPQPGGTPVFCLQTSSLVVAGSLWSQLPPRSSSGAKIPGVAPPPWLG